MYNLFKVSCRNLKHCCHLFPSAAMAVGMISVFQTVLDVPVFWFGLGSWCLFTMSDLDSMSEDRDG
jgi:hypothetical protein